MEAFYQNADTFKFLIPGQPIGTDVAYYFAAQDEAGSFISTLPSGGSGVNPPGTVAPENFFGYFVGELFTETYCSENIPKSILDLESTYDTLLLELDGAIVTDVDVKLGISHGSDGDLFIYLKRDDTETELSTGNGGNGNNYINTIFDDEATTSIQDGDPPFTGRYRPEEPLSIFDGKYLNGDWILHVYDNNSGDEGDLVQYCLDIQYYYEPVGIQENIYSTETLYQNYPNPASESTVIGFELSEPSFVSMELFNITGKKVKELTNRKYGAGNHQIELEVSGLPTGKYFYRMQTNNDVAVKSLTVVH